MHNFEKEICFDTASKQGVGDSNSLVNVWDKVLGLLILLLVSK